MSAASAADVAQLIAGVLRMQEQSLSRLPAGEAMYGEALAASYISVAEGGDPVALPPAPQRDSARREIEYVAQDAAVRRLWQRHRVVYDFDPDLWSELGDTEDDTVVPAGLMQRLPHPDPFVAFPEPLRLPLTRDGGKDIYQRVVGCFVNGRSGIRLPDGAWLGSQVSTHADNATGDLGLLIVGLEETETGAPIMAWPGMRAATLQRVTLNTGGTADTTVGALIAAIQSRFDTAPYAAGDIETELPLMIRRAMSALVYLCATNAELRPLPARPNPKRRGKTGAAKPPKVIRVGYETGAALRAWHKSERAAAASSGRTVRPHVRRSHFHTFWAGQGRTEKRVKWLPPIPVNATGKPADKPTVVRVPL